MKRIPEIRLKGFEGEWEETILGDVVQDCSYGVGAEAIPYDGKHKYIRITDIDDDSRNFVPNPLVSPSYYTPYYKVKENDLLFARTGASVGKTYLYHKDDGDLYYAGYLIKMNVMKADSEFVFLQTLLQKYKDWIVSESQRSGQPGINLQQLSNYFFNAPDIKEQQSIASFFSSFDSLIFEHQQRLENLRRVKKSMLQKMFPQQGQTVPEIRFKGFEGEWEKAKLSTFLTVSDEVNSNNFYGIDDVLSVSGDYGVVNQIEFQGRSFAGASVAGYGIAETGDVIYTKSPLKSNPYGIIKTNKGKPGIVSVLYGVYHPIKERTDSSFVQTYFESDARLNNYLRTLINKGSKNTLLISDEDALNGNVCFPNYKEQQRITAFFTSLDNLITQEVKYIDQLNRVKHTLLQKMFV